MKKYKMAILTVGILLCGVSTLGVYASEARTEKIHFLESNPIIYTKQSSQLRIREIDSKADLKQFKWSTSDSEVVKVNQSGIITGKKNGCAVVTIVSKENKNVKTSCKVSVKKFETRAIGCKKSYTSSTEKYLNEKKTYRIIKSYDELKQFQKKTQKAYVKANGKQAKAKFEKSAFNKKLNRYKKSYFKSKTLCIIEDSQSSSSTTFSMYRTK